MSVLINLSMFPTDITGSMSPYVAKIERAIRALGYPNQLGPMSTVVETPTVAEALRVIEAAYQSIAPDAARVYVSATMDIRRDRADRMEAKVRSVEEKLTAMEPGGQR